jgi:hypothetical protein
MSMKTDKGYRGETARAKPKFSALSSNRHSQNIVFSV